MWDKIQQRLLDIKEEDQVGRAALAAEIEAALATVGPPSSPSPDGSVSGEGWWVFETRLLLVPQGGAFGQALSEALSRKELLLAFLRGG